MRTGINLASRAFRSGEASPLGRRLLILVLGALSAVHLGLALHLGVAAAGGKRETARQEERLSSLIRRVEAARSELASPAASQALRELAAFDRSRVPGAPSPVEILSALAETLPADARVISVGLQLAPPNPRLMVEAVGREERAVSQLVRGLSRSPLLNDVEVLEERLHQNGQYRFRVSAALAASGRRR